MTESTPEMDTQQHDPRLTEMQELIHVISDINRSRHIDDILHAGLDGIRHVLDGRFGCYLLMNPALQKLELVHAESLPPPLFTPLQDLARHFPSPVATSPPHDPADLTLDLDDRIRTILRNGDSEPVTLVPLAAHGRPVGILIVGAGTRGRLTPPGEDLLLSIGEQLGMAIENAWLRQSLAESERFHRAFVEHSPDGIIEGQADGHVRYVNTAACQMLGYTRDELLRLEPGDLDLEPEVLATITDELHRASHSSRRIVNARTRKGESKTFSLSAGMISEGRDANLGYQLVLRDVTEQERSIAMLDRRNQELSALNAVSNILSHPLEIGRALDQVCEQITLITGMETAAIYLADPRRREVRLVAQRGMDPALMADVQRVGLDDAIARSISIDGELYAADDVMLYTAQGLAGPRRAGYHAGIGVPIKQRGAALGAVFVGSKMRFRYEKSDVALLVNIGERVGMALENHDLYAEMERRVGELDGLSHLSAACTASLDFKSISQLAVEWTRKLLHGDSCCLYVLDGDHLRLETALGYPAGAVVRERLRLSPRLQAAIAARAPLAIDDHSQDASPDENQIVYLRTLGIRSSLTVPLPTPNGIIGILSVERNETYAWPQREIDLLQTIANQAANALHNAQLYQNVVSEQRKVQAIFDSGISGLFATDAQGRIVMFNRAAERITGWTSQDTFCKKWADILIDSETPGDEPLIDVALLRKQTAYVPYGRRIQTRDGRLIPVAEAIAPLINEEGTVTGAVGAFWDLTRERVAEQSRENFLRMMAHQMRNPLTVLVSALDLLDKPNLPKKRRGEMYALVKSQAERLRKFSDLFLELEKATHSLRPAHCRATPIVPLVRNLVNQFEVEHPLHRFQFVPCDPMPAAYADPERIEDILRNLIDNAVTYSAEGSTVTVTVQNREDQDQVDIAVRDHGIGIPFPDQEHIFDAFYRANQPEGRRIYGHGFGLYIARQMAQQMGGEVEFTSREGSGSQFHLILRRVSSAESGHDSHCG